MNKYIIKYTVGLLLILGVMACSSRDSEITDFELGQILAPYSVQAGITNFVDLDLTWKGRVQADAYLVELYKDSLKFEEEHFVHMDEVFERNFKYELEGDLQYSARIRAVSVDVDESNWATITFKSGLKSLITPTIKGDTKENSLIVRWPSGTFATHITLELGEEKIKQVISASEIAAGQVIIENLNPETIYAVTLYNNKQRIGVVNRETLPKGAIEVDTTDDLHALIANAVDGNIFILDVGDYLAAGEVLTVNKSITIRGIDEDNKPTIHAQIEVENSKVELRNLELDGSGTLNHVVRLISKTGIYDGIVIDGCEVKNYKKSILAGESTMVVEVKEFIINNSIFTNIQADGAEAIDIRAGFIEKLSITNSTFNNIAPSRSFIRLDDTAANFPGKTSTVILKNNTFYKVANSDASKGMLYVRFTTNEMIVEKNILAETTGFFSKESKTSAPACLDNNYFNAPNFLSSSGLEKAIFDESGTHTEEDPVFGGAATGDFTVNSGFVKSGDPRWLQ